MMDRKLDDKLALRTAVGPDDVERVAAFNGHIHGAEVAEMTRALFLHHPHTQLENLIFVEDVTSRQVVSSLCLIPWTWRYEGVDLPAGEMGIVGTLEGYRQRGLIRAQVELFQQQLSAGGFLLSHIQGIPHFYRQFGYEYALPLEGGLRLETRHIPDPSPTSFTFRLAAWKDLSVLMQQYDEAASELAIHAVRDRAVWEYLLRPFTGAETEHETWLIEDKAGQVAGYMRLPRYHFGEELVVDEVSRLSFDAALAALHHFKGLVAQRQKPAVRLNLPGHCTLMRLARSLGAYDLGTYAWQVYFPDPMALLRVLAPVLERRVAASPFAGMTRDVLLNLYRQAIRLCFANGQLIEVVGTDPTGDSAIRLPPLQLIPLLLGYRAADELRTAHPDVAVAPLERMLVETLFQKTTAFIHTPY
ncbi:MAG: GNAT family N-acetyltransferase [Anaerolineae bacterium]|nr:GNAT family N-acetyltransferase [Anaerolineae bacterium]